MFVPSDKNATTFKPYPCPAPVMIFFGVGWNLKSKLRFDIELKNGSRSKAL